MLILPHVSNTCIYKEMLKRSFKPGARGSRVVWSNIYNAFCSHHESNILSPIYDFTCKVHFHITKGHIEEMQHPYQSSLNDEAHVFV